MGVTKATQRKTKERVDETLALRVPSRELLEPLAVQCASDPTLDNTFQYAFAMSTSNNPSELNNAVTILDGLTKDYKHQIDCMYGSAIALYLLRRYDEAMSKCEAILRNKPQMRTVAELHIACIVAMEDEREAKIKKAAVEGTIGAAAVGLLVGIATILLSKQ